MSDQLTYPWQEMNEAYSGQLTEYGKVRTYVMAGNAIITLRSKKSGGRFTFKFTRPAEEDQTFPQPTVWLKTLTGPDNSFNYQFTGTFRQFDEGYPWRYKHGRHSRIGLSAPAVIAARWFMDLLTSPDPLQHERLLRQVEVWHEGRCGRCGRRLTVPESIATGFGPECVQEVARV